MRDTIGFGVTLLYALSASGGRCRERELPGLLARLLGESPPSGWRTTLARLRKSKLVFCHVRSECGWIRAAARGRARVLLPSPRAEIPFAPAGLIYFVSYDIPANDLRDAFRYRLRELGWTRLHKSLWASRKDLRPDAGEAVEELGLQAYVYVGTGTLLRHGRGKVFGEDRAGVMAQIDAIRAAVPDRLSAAFLDAVKLTERLRGIDAPIELDGEIRARWRGAWTLIRQGVESGPMAGLAKSPEEGVGPKVESGLESAS